MASVFEEREVSLYLSPVVASLVIPGKATRDGAWTKTYHAHSFITPYFAALIGGAQLMLTFAVRPLGTYYWHYSDKDRKRFDWIGS